MPSSVAAGSAGCSAGGGGGSVSGSGGVSGEWTARSANRLDAGICLAIFGTKSPSAIAAEGLAYARSNGYSDLEIVLIQELVTALQAWSGIQ